jgi:hypothetical protein
MKRSYGTLSQWTCDRDRIEPNVESEAEQAAGTKADPPPEAV